MTEREIYVAAFGEPAADHILRACHSARGGLIHLSDEQEALVKEWAADDRLWRFPELVEFNLRTFARSILREAACEATPAVAGAVRKVCGDGTSGAADHSGTQGHNDKVCDREGGAS